MEKRQITSHSAKETQNLAKKLAISLRKRKNSKKRALILALEGDLGGGKTTFLQGFAKGLGIRQKILSPTFIIMRKFQIPKSKFQKFYHFDCYRIQKSKEILDLGWREIISNPQNIIAVEWADRIRKILPKKTTKIKFKFIDKNTRHFEIVEVELRQF